MSLKRRRALPGRLGRGGHLDRVVIALGHAVEEVAQRPLDRLRRDPVLLIVPSLHRPAPLGLGEGLLHGAGDGVGVHDHLAVDVPRRPPRRLDERGRGAEVAFLVGIENGHEGDLGQIQALPQEVDAHEGVVLAEPQLANDGHAVQGVDVGVKVAHAQAVLLVVLGQVLGHALGERGDEDPLGALGPGPDLGHEIVDLDARGPHGDLRVHEPRRTDDLLGHRPPLPRLARRRAPPPRQP